MIDMPGAAVGQVKGAFKNGAKKVVSRAHFSTFLIKGRKVTFQTAIDIAWSFQKKEDGSSAGAAHTALLTTGKLERPGGAKYAYGFEDATDDGVRCFGHGGGAPGMNGALRICDSGYTIVVLANLDPPAASRMASFIMRRLPAK